MIDWTAIITAVIHVAPTIVGFFAWRQAHKVYLILNGKGPRMKGR